MRSSPSPSRRVPLALTVGGALFDWPGTAGSIRVPFEHGATIPRWRVHFRNINPREGRPGRASFRLSDVVIGESSGDGRWASDPIVISASLRGVPKVTAWQHFPLLAGKEYLLAYSWVADAPTRRVVGGGWTAAHATAPDAALTPTQIHPVDAWIEAEVPASTTVFAAFGDSLASGVTSTVPVRDSWPSIYGRLTQALPIHYTASGDTLKGWSNPEHYKWARWADFDRPDYLVHGMGFNDIGNGVPIWELQARHLASLEHIRTNITPEIHVATITPSGIAPLRQQQTRRAYNEWLSRRNPPPIPFHQAVSEDNVSLREEFDTDGSHMNTAGYSALASAVANSVSPPAPERRRLIRDALSDRSSLEPLHLTRPLGRRTETTTSRSCRIPFQVPRRTRRWRVVIANRNFRTNEAYRGQVRIRFLGYAPQVVREDGTLTSSAQHAPTQITEDLLLKDLSEEWISPWVDEPLEPDSPYLLTLGYQTSGTETTLNMGAGWWTYYKPINAALAEDPTAHPTRRQPFDIRIEVSKDDTATPTPFMDLIIGDSISAGSDSTFPILEAPAAISNRDRLAYTRLNTHGGTSIDEWIGPGWGNPFSPKWIDVTMYGRADRAVIALGNNDIHAGKTLAEMKASYLRLISITRHRVAENIAVCTVTPRTSWNGTTKENLRRAFNDWLLTRPDGTASCIDLGKTVESAPGGTPSPNLSSKDGIHFNSLGNAVLAKAHTMLASEDYWPPQY